MKAIWKYEIKPDIKKYKMPKGAEILSLQTQFGVPCIWVLVDENEKESYKELEIFGTGHKIPDLEGNKERKFIGTFLVGGDNLVFHAFEIINKE
jgi:hypothetical protein